MPLTVRSITVRHHPANGTDAFTSGDCVSGEITVDLAKDCEVSCLSVKFKGKASVMWSERSGKTTVVYRSKDKYFSVTQFFIRQQRGPEEDNMPLLTDVNGRAYSNILTTGSHVYPFTFQFPDQDMPSSYNGTYGKIVYSFEAKLSRSMRINSKASTKINFVSKVDPNSVPGLMMPQYGSKDKKMKIFTSGSVGMDVNLAKTGYHLGEGIKIMASVHNKSSREIKTKCCIYTKHSFFANGKRKLCTKDLFKVVGESIPPSTNRIVTSIIHIPPVITTSILNCSIIKVEYRIRVCLDVKYAFDPEIKFPIVILPATQPLALEQPPAYAGFGFETSGTSNQPACSAPPQFSAAPQPAEPPPPYDTCGMYPSSSDFGNKYP
ncbi:arrestin domain-containing protein 3-like [Lampris incognitus]|uniref:arrestin domain-containing protein 3-like n=1 Tax=Lampris incognitus TaxID=2546036 RepID=UPI0024B605E7|nr:arrestin domain-containing protein 3-like [Lampris incognitus]